jgi:hypothetical protein
LFLGRLVKRIPTSEPSHTAFTRGAAKRRGHIEFTADDGGDGREPSVSTPI